MAQNTPPPIPTQSPMLTNDGLVTRVWIAWFTYLKGIFGYNQTVQNNGAILPQELAINFSDQFVVTDNATNGSTDVSLAPASYTIQMGTAQVAATGGDYASVNVDFPTEFSAVPNIQATANGFPRGANAPMSCIVSNKRTDGFTINLACAVPTGGGGATIDQQISCDWVAIG